MIEEMTEPQNIDPVRTETLSAATLYLLKSLARSVGMTPLRSLSIVDVIDGMKMTDKYRDVRYAATVAIAIGHKTLGGKKMNNKEQAA